MCATTAKQAEGKSAHLEQKQHRTRVEIRDDSSAYMLLLYVLFCVKGLAERLRSGAQYGPNHPNGADIDGAGADGDPASVHSFFALSLPRLNRLCFILPATGRGFAVLLRICVDILFQFMLLKDLLSIVEIVPMSTGSETPRFSQRLLSERRARVLETRNTR
ncbi:hypothetical protein L596_006458 [Steinernema carpocapsae]|uniref:Uncharacterized protein n=1 Tax=Steinernema carpocapsae TaxID=34508 RepID=A0A4U8V4F8_STECR|nr:hypothetical protein L596_006458 [Steinernema carpocapsae]